MAVILETSLGDITVDLYTDERPRCCLNFLKLCKIKYYNFCLFHSVQKNLVAQTGDKTGTGKSGESIFRWMYGDQAKYFDAEVKPRIKHKKLGLLSMVNNGDNMHGSQFFVTLAPDLDYLDGVHTVFGEVAEGFEILDKLNETFTDKEGRPYQDIRIYHTVILDDPYDDPPQLEAHIPDRSPEPTKEQLQTGRIGVDEDIDDTKGKTDHEIDEFLKEKEARANAQLLEMVGDLPDADIKPPDNVLFVCKLNPVTTSEDLEVIFSRFGHIESCEVICDQKSGESLQYAFIEFQKEADCESAYFKMDNVLIDDRRIHVDFSQSVSKVKWKGKGKGVEYPKKDEPQERPTFVIRDRSKKDKYELVFTSDEDAAGAPSSSSHRKHKKKKHHKHKRESSEEPLSSSKKQHQMSRSRSRSRSRSPQRKHRDQDTGRDRESGRDRDTGRDRDRDQDTGRDRDTDRDRDNGRDRDRGRDRDKGRDRDNDMDREDSGRDRYPGRDRDPNRNRDNGDRDASRRSDKDRKSRRDRRDNSEGGDRDNRGDRHRHGDRDRDRYKD